VTESEPFVSVPDFEQIQNLTLSASDQPSSPSHIQILEQPPINILESEFIEAELLKISKEMQDLVQLRRVPTLSVDYEDQWSTLKSKASELINVVSQKCCRIQAAALRRHLRILHLAEQAKGPFLYLVNAPFKMLKQKVLKQQEEDSLLQRQLALEETVKQQADLLKKQSENITRMMALIQQQQQQQPNP